MVAGTAFALTACAYGVMTVKMLDPTKLGADEQTQFFVKFMDEHGVNIMLVELGLLAICTFAAIGTDGFWSRESKSRKRPPAEQEQSTTVGNTAPTIERSTSSAAEPMTEDATN